MAKTKYYFNTDSLKFERVVVSFRKKFSGYLAGFQRLPFWVDCIIAGLFISRLTQEKQLKRELSGWAYNMNYCSNEWT
ncbi:MAG: hypothetical protein IPJ26_16080 [Bacteroidetes bacterium]|nr:hypothetical protein [Bacteroidota bacterium]